MGEYADMSNEADIETWSGGNGRGWGEPPTLFKKVIACHRCGCTPLYWAKSGGEWKPHHFRLKTGKFVIHQCGFKSDGTQSEKWPFPRKKRALSVCGA